jgi:stage II sporulation protein E
MDSAMAGEGSAESLPTLDLCSLDLYEGECTFLKAGAAASFIKRGSAVERITGTALPLGACGDAQPQPIKRSVSDGDYIVMMTDGMTEGWPNGDGEKQLETLLSGINGISPSEMAGILLRFAIEQRGGRIRDDMTVLCAGIWEKGEGI